MRCLCIRPKCEFERAVSRLVHVHRLERLAAREDHRRVLVLRLALAEHDITRELRADSTRGQHSSAVHGKTIAGNDAREGPYWATHLHAVDLLYLVVVVALDALDEHRVVADRLLQSQAAALGGYLAP